MTKEAIKKLIAQDHLAEAIQQLMALVNAYLLIHPKDQTVAKIQQALIVNSGKYKGLEQDQVLGILNRADEQTTIAQVRTALLYAIDELSDKVWQSKVGSKTPESIFPSKEDSSNFDFDLFLSFSAKDRDAARLIWETLRGLGYRVFLSDEALKAYAGMSFLDKINSALRKSQHFLLLCTPTAVESPWVKLECDTFFTRFHLLQPNQRRFFIFERGGKKKMDDIYQNLQTLGELPDLIDLLQSLNGQSNKTTITVTVPNVDPERNKLTQPEKALEARLQKEQIELEKAASAEATATLATSKADLLQVKNSALLIDFYQKYGENATPKFYELHESIIQNFGAISELELDDLIADLARENKEREQQELQRKRIIEVEIPQSIQAFVNENRGEWTRRSELAFMEEISSRFNGILAKAALANLMDEAKLNFQKKLQDFVHIKGGTFTMGAPADEPDSGDHERPQHEVQVSDFYLSKCPVTLAQFEAFILASGYQTDADKDGGSNFWTGSKWEKKAGINWTCDMKGNLQQDKQHPVIHVSWNDAKAYCDWLAQKLDVSVRLPREAEWEYACRAGTSAPFYTGKNLTTEQANYNGYYPYANFPKGTYLEKTSPVGAYPANPWGLYDLHGNVWEWCTDWYSEAWYKECKKQGIVHDPTGPGTGSGRVLRGGSWSNLARGCRAALRNRREPGYRHADTGFRPAISL